jgi:hypothetical protein
MKIRRSILWFIAIVAVLIATVLWFGKKKPEEAPLTVSVETNPAPLVAARSNPPVSAPVQTNALMTLTTNGADLSKSPPQSKTERAIGLLSTYNDVPIDFYGKVEDQFSNGVAGAAVNFSVRVMNGQESTVERGQVITDGNGFFTITGYKGQDLGLAPQKAGYVLATTSTLFKYSHLEDRPYVSDPNNPTVIKMWKLQGAEPLVGINETFKLPYTGAPIFFDLVTGNVVPGGGDLEIIVTRTPGVITQRNHGDWSIKLVPVNGGIIETDYHAAQVTFEAPIDSYQDTYFVQMNHDDPGWFDNIQRAFFLMSRGGQVYSRFSLDFGINDDPDGAMWFQFKGVANANGSRNWEAAAPQ